MSSGNRFHAWQDSRRVAVLGMSSSGKTVFLTSLIDRILRADGSRDTSLFGNLTWRVDRLSPVDGVPRFQYEYYREDCLRLQRWPDKTLASSQFRLRRTREGDGARGALLRHYAEERTFIDIPGERVADFSIAGRTYAEWSDVMIATLGEPRHAPYAESYLTLLDSDLTRTDEAQVLDQYKRVLARFTQRQIPFVTPSTFLVDETGRYPGRRETPAHEQSADQLVANRLSGLEPGHEFAPLPERARTELPDVAGRFAQRYDDYRAAIADPLGAGFSSCDQLIVLVDVLTILESGPAAYHATRKNLQLALEYLDPGSAPGSRLRALGLRLLSAGRWGGGVRDIAVIATKADCVHQLDRANLVPLLESMTRDIFGQVAAERGLRVEFFHCAAIAATTSDEYPWMTGFVASDGGDPNQPERLQFKVSALPGEWPAESAWQPDAFAFANPEPPVLDLIGRTPFPGINMDKVTSFIGWPDRHRR